MHVDLMAATTKPRIFGGLRALTLLHLRWSLLFSTLVPLSCIGCGANKSPVAGSPAVLVVQGPEAVTLGTSVTYSAVASGAQDSNVRWSLSSSLPQVDVGSISSRGVYTPPAVMPAVATVTVVASAAGAAASNGSLQVSLSQPTAKIASATLARLANAASYLLDVQASNLGSAPVLVVNGSTVATQRAAAGNLQASIPASQSKQLAVAVVNSGNGSTTSAVYLVTVPADPVAPITPTAAARLLDQATFGPTDALIAHVQKTGLAGFLDEQFAIPASVIPTFAKNPPDYCGDLSACTRYAWWNVALNGNDQLRQRVAFALSEMFVVSAKGVDGPALPGYLNILSSDAFANWYTLMKDITLSPAMGAYLNMVNSVKPGDGLIANQNFAREMLQLFSLGTVKLNINGTPALDGLGKSTPTYTQSDVDGFARALTGWTYGNSNGSELSWSADYDRPMIPIERYHDTSEKVLLGGAVLPAGQSATQDLDAALGSIFNSTTLPPFVCRQLIQHLVTSNPSPDYVARVTAIFQDDGSGTRGNLKAVISAILRDNEARAGDAGEIDSNFGHLREPILWITSSLRGLEATPAKPDLTSYVFPDVAAINMLEQPQGSPSVFNFFTPGYRLAGTSVSAPEFELEQTASSLTRMNVANQIVFSAWIGYLNIDFTVNGPWASLTTPDPNALMDRLSVVFLHGMMSAAMRDTIVQAISGVTSPTDKARMAVYLVITSPQYKLIR